MNNNNTLANSNDNLVYSQINLTYMRQFYLSFPICHVLRDKLAWTHYKLIMKVENEPACNFYMDECIKSNWSTRQLERQMNRINYKNCSSDSWFADKITLYLFILSTIFAIQNCSSQNSVKINEVYRSENLIINQITDNIFEHISYLNTIDFGKIACNGMIVADGGEAVIFDTPTNDKISTELLDWLTDKMNLKVTAIIPTHFHVDNLGGLAEFHKRGIPSYAYFLTIDFANKNGYTLPQNAFTEKMELSVGKQKIIAEFFGEGHTRDNIIGYFPKGKVLFGGCLLKELGAGKGNLEDANVDNWAKTAEKLKTKYPDTQIVIPGHGKLGGPELIDYTINLFK